MRRQLTGALALIVLLVVGGASAQELPDFKPGIDGEIYYAPRLDLIAASQGGPLRIELDGILDEPFWEKAAWHGMNNLLVPPDNEEDADLIFAAAADDEFLYVAWQFTDDVLVIGESTFCDVPGHFREFLKKVVDRVEFDQDKFNELVDADSRSAEKLTTVQFLNKLIGIGHKIVSIH